MKSRLNRRRFLTGAAAGAAALGILRNPLSARSYQANEKLGVALVGVSGRGSWFVQTIPKMENVTALCDVNRKRAAEAFALFPDVPKFADFRVMLDKAGRQIDAVICATTDHTHGVISMAAIKAGKGIFCEKPLAHDVGENRALRLAAREHKVATQMGNQGTASEAFRRGVELVQAGVIGEVREVHVYNSGGGTGPKPPPAESMPVPEWLDWDLWLGPNASRPYHPDWMNRHSWREFGTSQLGNWATHSANLPFKALRIDSLWHADPADAVKIRLEAEVSSIERVNFPKWAVVRYDVPARGDLPPVKLIWHQGTDSPGFQDLIARIVKHGLTEDPRQVGPDKFTHHAGCLLVGTEGMLYAIAHNTSITLLPQEKFAGLEGPPETLPRSRGHEREWFDACRGGPPAMSNFDYSGPLTEFLMLGNIATQFDHPIEFDPMAGKITNSPEADKLVLREYREGWTL